MHEKVKNFLEAREALSRKQKQAERNAHLVELGLYEEVYSGGKEFSEEFPFSDGEGNSYKRVAVEVTDEEYEKICRYAPETEEKSSFTETLRKALVGVAVLIFIVGGIGGIVLGAETIPVGEYGSETVFSFATALSYWAAALISGLLFLSLSEILRLLEKISKK